MTNTKVHYHGHNNILFLTAYTTMWYKLGFISRRADDPFWTEVPVREPESAS